MEPLSVSPHPIVKHAVGRLMDPATERRDYIALLHQIGMHLAFFASADLTLKKSTVKKLLQNDKAVEFEVDRLEHDNFVVVPILRSGLILSEGVRLALGNPTLGMLGVTEKQSDNRMDGKKKANAYLVSLPKLDERTVFLVDAVLHSTAEAQLALDYLKAAGASDIRWLTVSAYREAAFELMKHFENLRIYCAVLEVRNKSSDPSQSSVPAIGGELEFGGIGDPTIQTFGY
ncbi:MAG TPA: hypothetical protein DCL54_00930 [Alphaproteobacteria bacterium]|nr:hypothetical protein [Alphaproteobacteria bacterium]HAJ45130.1 hypothetical protein [Alphaproteobacteria bacterium]